MTVGLQSPARKVLFTAACLAGVGALLFWSWRAYSATRLGNVPEVAAVVAATQLEPDQPEHWFRLANLYFFVHGDHSSALRSYQRATELLPYRARYWLGLANLYEVTGQLPEQRAALDRALWAEPTTPANLWTVSNFFIIHNELDRAFPLMRTAMEKDPALLLQGLELCWRVTGDADRVLREAVPPKAHPYAAFLQLLIEKNEKPEAIDLVWSRLIALRQPFEEAVAFRYVDHLLAGRRTEVAWQAWLELLRLAYPQRNPSRASNLMVNSGFDEDVINAGFDWRYESLPNVRLSLDPANFHSGTHSLSVRYDGETDANPAIYQLIPVQHNAAYQFTAYTKSEELEGGNGPYLVIEDFYTNAPYLTKEVALGSTAWVEVKGSFTTGPDTKLLRLKLARRPIGRVRGALWLDELRLVLD